MKVAYNQELAQKSGNMRTPEQTLTLLGYLVTKVDYSDYDNVILDVTHKKNISPISLPDYIQRIN